MILIADSGSTKTDWCLLGDNTCNNVSTQGINPFLQGEAMIFDILHDELLPQLEGKGRVNCCYFYGAGCTPEKSPIVSAALMNVLSLDMCEVQSDLLGAARALCGRNEGIACILGTGSNSCYYDGSDIVRQVSPLGYILGDEGGAAYIGKRLVGNCLKRQFSDSLCDLFFEETHLDGPTIINKVYREPLPNRFLGQVSQFCQQHLDNDEIELFIIDCFMEFFRRNVISYARPELPVNFVGSIAHVYRIQLEKAASQCGLTVGTILRAPMPGLIEYHKK